MICISVFDGDKAGKEMLRSYLVKYMVQDGIDLDLLWLPENISEDDLEKYAAHIQLALISLDSERGKETGDAISLLNPECRILYYKSSGCDIEALLTSRPRAFLLRSGQEKEEEFISDIREIIGEIMRSGGVFRYETKRTLYTFPCRDILYLQSDMKYIRIYNTHGGYEQIYAKLSDAEGLLGSGFLRIHKSYIVNTMYMEKVDKKERLVYMKGGECLPISQAQYKNVIQPEKD